MSISLTEQTAFQYWAQLDCPTSLGLSIAAKAGDWMTVLTHKVGPENFIDPYDYAQANAAVCFLKKNPDVQGSTQEARKAACAKSWKEGEASCYRANERLSPILVAPLSGDPLAEFLRKVRTQLLSWLRHAPDDAEMQHRARHGPGKTFSSLVTSPTAADKYSEPLTLTHGATWYLANIVGTKWFEETSSRYVTSSRDCIQYTRGNRFTTVPKTALTDRGIAVEATLNIYQQLAVGGSIRARLRRYAGWDLDHAASIHREMARTASIDGSFATLDLSNASDSLCKNLVKVILRDTSWLPLLEDLRSPMTRFDGKWHLLEKFSSMGNGYTFELETCIFAAIASVCLQLSGHSGELGKDLFVFGDDIIVPTDTHRLVVAALRWCGFEINKEKSFASGPFRESCGADYFLGHPVRGFYLKDRITYGTQRIFTVHNGAKVCLDRCGVSSPWLLGWIRRNLLPARYRSVGGSSRLGDSVLHGVQSTEKWRRGIRWVKAVEWTKPTTVKWSYFSPNVRLACRLTGYGHTFGIDSRGVLLSGSLVWVSDS
jgi:hypothetical protein